MAYRITRSRKAEMFQQYKPMAYKLGAQFAKRFGKSTNEMQDEALSILGDNIADWQNHFDPSRASRTTWIYRRLYWHLLNYCTRNGRPMASIEAATEKGFDVEARPDLITTLAQNLGEEAMELVRLIIESPHEIAEDLSATTCRRARGAVRKYLLNRGWPETCIHRVWQEVRECLV